MIIVFRRNTPRAEIDFVEQRVIEFGYEPRVIHGTEQSVIAAVGDETSHKSLEDLLGYACIEKVMPVQKRHKLASREFHAADSVVEIGDNKLGAGHFLTIAGPCSVESREQMHQVAKDIHAAGLRVLRGGAFKPRTSPYDFQGLGEEGLALLAEVKEAYGLAIVTEVLGSQHLDQVAAVADMIQIGARNCQNYQLLELVAKAGRPVMLKRGMATLLDEWLLAAEYLLVNGCSQVILCERGIRTFEGSTRFTLDLGSAALAKRETHLPVIVDPSHPAGREDLVLPLARAAIAAGVDGLMVETHPDPPQAMSDAAQQIPSAAIGDFMAQLQPLLELCAAGNYSGSSENAEPEAP